MRRGPFSVLVGVVVVGAVGLAGCKDLPPVSGPSTTVSRTADDLEPGSLRAVLRALPPSGPMIVVIPGGEYTLSVCGPPDDTGATGDLDLRVDADVTLLATGPVPVVIRQTCDGERVLDQLGTGKLRLFDVTITGGRLRGTDPAEPAAGGGVRAAGPVELAHARITGNRATGAAGRPGVAASTDPTAPTPAVPPGPGGAATGAGIAAGGDVISSRPFDVIDNVATGGPGGLEVGTAQIGSTVPVGGRASGGGIATPGRVELAGGTVRGNQALGGRGSESTAADGGLFAGASGGDGVGGAVAAGGFSGSGVRFEANKAEGGAARFIFFGRSGTTFGEPGGAAEGGAVAVTGTLTDQRSSFKGNQAVEGTGARGSRARGGGLHAGGDAALHWTAFDANQATRRDRTERTSSGGAIFGGGAVTLDGVPATGNVAEHGGAVRATGPVTLRGANVEANRAIRGGGISGGGAVTVTDSTVRANHLYNRSEARGAGVFATGAVTVTGSTFADNVIDAGDAATFPVLCAGGICALPGDTSVRGGAIRSDGSVTATRSTFTGNRAEGGARNAPLPQLEGDARGGALSAPDVRLDTVTLDRSTSVQYRYEGPFVPEPGAAAAIDATAAHLSAVTVAESSGADAIGAARLDVRASALGSAGPAVPECAPGTTVTSGGANRFDDDSCGTGGAGDAVAADLRLLPLSDYGGPLFTHLPGPGSPVIDAVPVDHPACTGTDQREVPRPAGRACDAGAVEATDVDFAPDVSVITDQPAFTVGIGGTGTFRATVRNHGTEPVSAGVRITVPPAFEADRFAPQPGGTSCGGTTDGMECNWWPDIEPGESRTVLVTIHATGVLTPGPAAIDVLALAGGIDPEPGNNHVRITADVVDRADLSLSAVAEAPWSSGHASLRLSLHNAGPAAAARTADRPVRVRVQLAPGVVFEGAEGDVCAAAGEVLTCTFASGVGVGESWLRLNLRATGPVPAVVATAAIVDSDVTDPDPTNDTTEAVNADLSLTATRPTGPVAVGQDLPVELVVTNKGPVTARDVLVGSGRLPVEQVVSTVPDVGVVGTDDHPGYLDWHIPSLAAGATARLRLTVRTPGAEDILETSVASAALDFAGLDNRVDVDLRAAPEGLADLTFDPPTVKPFGETQHVRVVIRNTGPAAMTATGARPVVFAAYDPQVVGPILATTSDPGWRCDGRSCHAVDGLAVGATAVIDVLAGSAERPVDQVHLYLSGGTTAESDRSDNELIVDVRRTPS